MKKKNMLVAFVIIMLLFLSYILTPNFNRARPQAKKKACVANMRTIQNAIELYLEKNSKEPPPAVFDINLLVSEGFLKALPRCPSITDGYTASRRYEKTGPGYELTCSVHGDLSRQETDHRLKGIEETETLLYHIREIFVGDEGLDLFRVLIFVILTVTLLRGVLEHGRRK